MSRNEDWLLIMNNEESELLSLSRASTGLMALGRYYHHWDNLKTMLLRNFNVTTLFIYVFLHQEIYKLYKPWILKFFFILFFLFSMDFFLFNRTVTVLFRWKKKVKYRIILEALNIKHELSPLIYLKLERLFNNKKN